MKKWMKFTEMNAAHHGQNSIRNYMNNLDITPWQLDELVPKIVIQFHLC